MNVSTLSSGGEVVRGPDRAVAHVRLARSGVGSDVVAQTTGFLADAVFRAVQEVVAHHAGRQETAADGRRGYVFPLAALPEVARDLAARSVRCELTSDLIAVLRARSEATKSQRSDASARTKEIRSRLAARGEAMRPFQEIGVEFLAANDRAILADQMALGKGGRKSDPVLTLEGWTTYGRLRPGDSVVGCDGRAVRVKAVYDRGVLPMFRVRFNDGPEVVVSGDHLWAVRTPNQKFTGKPYHTETTDLIAAHLRDGAGNLRHYVPLVRAPELVSDPFDGDRTLDPYLLGSLLGDGSLSEHGVSFCKPDEDYAEALRSVLPEGDSLVRNGVGGATSWRANGGRTRTLLREMDLLGRESHQKFVPRSYLWAPSAVRHAVAQGLLDTDGTASSDGSNVQFNTTSPRLASDFAFLVRSLGGVVYESTRTPHYTYLGRRLEGRLDHRLTVVLPPEFPPFRLARKAERHARRRSRRDPVRAIEAVEPCGEAECVCISVDAEDGLYVANDFVVTHNTLEALLAAGDKSIVIWVTRGSLVGDAMAAAKRWRPEMHTGSGHLRWWPTAGQIHVISYDQVPEKPPVGQPPPNVVLIADEAKALKGRTNVARVRRFRALSKAVAASKDARRWLLEGTPLLNDYEELYNLLDHIDLARELFGSRARFRQLVRDDPSQIAPALRRVMLRRCKDEVWPEMPRTVRSEHRVTLDAGDRAALDACLAEICEAAALRARDDHALAHPDADAAALDAVAAEARANVQRAIDLAFDGQLPIPFELTSRVKSILALAKSRHTIALLRDIVPPLDAEGRVVGQPLLLFSQHVRPVLDAAAAIPGAASMTGQTPGAERTDIVRAFQEERRIPLLAMTGETGGVGFNLPAAATGVWNDLPWNDALVTQAEDRMRRLGQVADRVSCIRVVADHVLDARIQELILEKQDRAERTVGRTQIRGAAGNEERPAVLGDAIDRLLERAVEVRAGTPDVAREPATETERWTADALLRRSDTLRRRSDLRTFATTFREEGRLTDAQWDAVTTTLRFERAAGRGPVTAAEREVAALLAATNAAGAWRAGQETLGRDYSARAAGPGLAEGEWALAALFVRKYRKEGSP